MCPAARTHDVADPVGPALERSAGRESRELRSEETLGEALIDIVRMSNAAIATCSDDRAEQILPIRQRAVEGLEDLRRERDARMRDHLLTRKLMPSLRQLACRFQAQTKIFTELRTPRREPALPDDVAWALFAVADEALEGLERRSRATGVVMILRASEQEISMSIRDDGVGLLARQGTGWRASPHGALRVMRRRIEAVGGAVSVNSARPRGLLVRAAVPLRVC